MAGHARSRSVSVAWRALAAGLLMLAMTNFDSAAHAAEEQVQASPSVDFWERVPGPTLLLVPVAVGLAVLIGVVLGPVGRPSPVIAREGGLSRALARRRSGGSGDD